ncbi:MAG: hypothetical protein QOH96_1151, partial [Blastocatellia bacterium]|nr:hypothetical protein [Blastocatellia bacterium]
LALAFVLICSRMAASQERPLDWKFSTDGVPLVDDKETGLTFYGLEQGAQAAFKSVDDVKGAVVVLPGPRMDDRDRKKAIAGGIDPDRMLTAMAVALVLPMPADASDFFISKEDWKGLYVYRWKLKNGAEACASSLPLKPYSDEHDVLFVWSCSFKPDNGVLVVTRNGEKSIKGYEDYVPRTIRQIIQEHSDLKILSKNNLSMLLTGDTFSSRVKAVYTGQSRKISPEKKQHLDMLVTSFNVDQKIIDQYGTEFLFLEGTTEHWLPVQARLIPMFGKELKKGEQVTLYTEWVGAKKIGGKWEWIFMVHEFQKQ